MNEQAGEKDGLDVSWKDCGYYEEVSWKRKYACFHSGEFMWCENCPRLEGVIEDSSEQEGKHVD